MHREITIAEPEPGLAAECAERLHERPGLVAPTPTEQRVVESRQGVHDRVEIGRDTEAKMLEIIAGVADDQQILGRQHAA